MQLDGKNTLCRSQEWSSEETWQACSSVKKASEKCVNHRFSPHIKSLPMGHNIKESLKKELHGLTVLLCCPTYTLVGLEATTSRIGGTNEDWELAKRLYTTTYFLSWDWIFCVDSDCKSLYCLGVIDLLMFSISKIGEISTKWILHEHPETNIWIIQFLP